MGVYLNSRRPHDNYLEIAASTYFVDKSRMLEELIPIVEQPEHTMRTDHTGKGKDNKYICITRPRRFGKTVMANMIASYFGRGQDSRELFSRLAIGSHDRFEAHLNQHNVIYISFNEMPRDCTTYKQYIDRIQDRMIRDLRQAFPDAEINTQESLWDAFNDFYELSEATSFIFVLDEWDFIFHQGFVTELDKKAFISFLSNLLKDQPYVELAYMTGILPIAKYSSGSELNMFCEYTMVSEEKYSEFFGFTDTEVAQLFTRYQSLTTNPQVTIDGLRIWYDGYHTRSGVRVYNPRSVVLSMTNNNLGNYWTSSGPYDEIFYYIEHNIDAVRDDLALMVSDISVPAKIYEYAATSMNLKTRDEIFSAMVVYGFLSYENGCVRIPNKELMDKFDDMLQREPSLGYIFQLSRESDRLLQATLAGDTDTICRILEYTHNTEIPLLSYNNESDLTVVVTLAYLSARNQYEVNREDKSGTGYADFIFTPVNHNADCMILELKIDSSPEDAIRQIKERQYSLRFMGKLGETPKYTGRILAVGITYDKKSKKHHCKVEVLREAL